MGFCVEHSRFQREEITVREEEVEVFKGLREPEAFHIVVGYRGDDIRVGERGEGFDVGRGVDVLAINCVRGRGRDVVDDCGVFDEVLEHFPTPVAVNLVTGDAVHVEKGLDGLWPLQVMPVCRTDFDVVSPSAVHVLQRVEGLGV